MAATGAASAIVIVLHDFASGGTEHVAIRMANIWAAAGRRVTIFCGTEHGPLRSRVAANVPVVRAPRECRRSLFSRLTLAEALADFTAAEWPDTVFAPGNFHLPVLARFGAIDRSDAVTIAKLSNPIASPFQSSLFRKLHSAAHRRVLGGIDHFVAMSPALRAEAATILDAGRIAHAWEPLLGARNARGSEGPRVGQPLFLAIGRLEHQKRFALAIEALALSACRDAKLLILGEGAERAKLSRVAARLGVADRVTLAGYRRNIEGALDQASALLLPSRYEGYPAVAVEAIAAGVPVIATRCSRAIDEILSHDGRSRIVPPRPEAFAAAMDQIVARPAPARLPSETLLARHDVTNAAHSYLALLDDLCAAAKNRAPGARSGT